MHGGRGRLIGNDVGVADSLARRLLPAARRLRSRWAEEPARLYHGLRRLSDQADRLPRARADNPTSTVARRVSYDAVPISGTPQLTPAGMVFIPLVRASFDGAILRYSVRQRLLREAARAGIGRFHANMLIAAVQHELQQHGVSPIEDGDHPASTAINDSSSAFQRFTMLSLALAAEWLCVVTVWRHLH